MCVLPSGWALGLCVYKNALKPGNIKIDTLRRNDCFVKIVSSSLFSGHAPELEIQFYMYCLNAIEVAHLKVRNIWCKLYNYYFVTCLQSFTQRKFMN